MAPILDEIADDYEGKVQVKKIDVDSNQLTASKYEVLSIPALFLFEGGEVKKKLISALPKKKLWKNSPLARHLMQLADAPECRRIRTPRNGLSSAILSS